MASQVMRITLKAYDHQLVDASAKKIIETVKKNGAKVSGPNKSIVYSACLIVINIDSIQPSPDITPEVFLSSVRY